MSDGEKKMANTTDTEENQYEYQSETDDAQEDVVKPQPKKAPRTMQRARRQPQQQQPNYAQTNGYQVAPPQPQQQQQPADDRVTGNMGGRTGAIRESRIKDRPRPAEERDSSLKIKIELDLEVEVDLYARVKGDVTIGLM